MSDHHQTGDTPLYGSGPGAPYPPRPEPVQLPTHTQAMRPYTSLPDQPRAEPVDQFVQRLQSLRTELAEASQAVDDLADSLTADRSGSERTPAGGTEPEEDTTRFDHLAVNTVKDDPYGMDANLPQPSQAPEPTGADW